MFSGTLQNSQESIFFLKKKKALAQVFSEQVFTEHLLATASVLRANHSKYVTKEVSKVSFYRKELKRQDLSTISREILVSVM